MKKSLFFYAAAALALTACTSEDDILQTGPEKKAAPQEVGFDVYTSSVNDVTRAGFQGTLNTNRLQRNDGTGDAQWNVGFGIYAFYSDQTTSSAAADGYYELNTDFVPNFMWNEKILWDKDSKGWYYSPLKYWPNETINDSQADEKAYMENKTDDVLDRLTFFAYAPYVENGVDGQPGITAITDNDGKIGSTATDPSVNYQAPFATTDAGSNNPNQGVDLLWGVAPAGGLTYTAVNGTTVTVDEGNPLINMTKPDVNTSMKFLFQHALARFGVTVAAAIDQLPQGGKIASETKITIEKVKITGYFGETGQLNLNNKEKSNIANWRIINGNDIEALKTDGTKDPVKSTIIISGTNIKGNLRYKEPYDNPVEQPVVGVTTARQDLIAPSTNHYGKMVAEDVFNFDPAKVYYTSDDASHPTFTEAHAKYKTISAGQYYSKSGDVFSPVPNATEITSPKYPEALMSDYYTIFQGPEYTSLRSAAVLYTDETRDAYNTAHSLSSGLGGYKTAGDPFSAEEAAEYNTNHNLTSGMGGYKVGGETVTTEEASFYKTHVPTSPINAGGTFSPTQATNYNTWCNLSSGMEGFKSASNTFTSAEATEYNTNHDLTSGMGGFAVTGNVAIPAVYAAPDLAPDTKFYTRTGEAAPYTYTYAGTTSSLTWTEATKDNKYYTLTEAQVPITDIAFKYAAGTYYTPERNFYMVVPTNNIPEYNTNGWGEAANKKILRTIDVEITYYITTEDAKLAKKRSQTKNVITKTVELPSLANGKSYNLNLLLGLTSVKVEADVADWKEEYVQVDLPQNTAE